MVFANGFCQSEEILQIKKLTIHPGSNPSKLIQPSKLLIMKLMQGTTVQHVFQRNDCTLSDLSAWKIRFPKEKGFKTNNISKKRLGQYLEEQLGHYFSTTCHMIPFLQGICISAKKMYSSNLIHTLRIQTPRVGLLVLIPSPQ